MNRRPDFGACCMTPFISSPSPACRSTGKPVGVRCVLLSEDPRCLLFGHAQHPATCNGRQPNAEMCGEYRAHAATW